MELGGHVVFVSYCVVFIAGYFYGGWVSKWLSRLFYEEDACVGTSRVKGYRTAVSLMKAMDDAESIEATLARTWSTWKRCGTGMARLFTRQRSGTKGTRHEE